MWAGNIARRTHHCAERTNLLINHHLTVFSTIARPPVAPSQALEFYRRQSSSERQACAGDEGG
jgi:hypothetical protein